MYPKSLEVSAIKYTPDIKNIKVINELLRQFHCSPHTPSSDAFRVSV